LQEHGTGPHIWVITSCALAIALGTYIGGWRIIDTLGTKLTTVKAAQGLSAETTTAAAILASSHLGFALSTTQVASGSVLGSGLGRKGADVQWSTAGRIASGWLLTIPAAAIVGAVAAAIAHLGTIGVLIDTVIAVVVVLWIYLSSRQVEETDLSGFDAVGEAVNIRGRKPKRREDRNRKRAMAGRKARREAWEEKEAAEEKRRASRRAKRNAAAQAEVGADSGQGTSAGKGADFAKGAQAESTTAGTSAAGVEGSDKGDAK